MKQTLQKPTVLYDTTFPAGTQLDYDSLREMGIVCSITIPAPQRILDQSPVAHQLAVSQITFPKKTTFFYKKRNGQTPYAAQRVPSSLLLTQDLTVAGITIPTSTDWSFITNVDERGEEGGAPEELEANHFRATLRGVIQKSVEINEVQLRAKTHVLINEREVAWHYTEATNNERTHTEARGALLRFRPFVEQALEVDALDACHYEALRFLSTDYFKETVEWACTLLGCHYRIEGETLLAAQYYRRAYRIAVRTKGARSVEAQQLDYLLSKLRVGASVVEKKYVLRRLYLANILLIVVLFYVGVHLREETAAIAAGLRPNGLSYDWASLSYAILATGCGLFALYVGWRTFATLRRIGGMMLGLSLFVLAYSGYVLWYASQITMTDALLLYGPYIVFSLWLNAYALMLRDGEIIVEEEIG